ncbi:MAG: hypothetical protein WCE32_26240, partial [Pseudolabrys sp.]
WPCSTWPTKSSWRARSSGKRNAVVADRTLSFSGSHSLSSDLILAPLRRVKKICQDEGAVLLFVDFWETSRWRAHGAMANWLRQANIEMQSIAPREILMDYKF